MREFIITGGRDYDDWAMLQEVLNILEPDLVVQGGASGADKMAKEWAELNKIETVTIKADWGKHGRAAGPIRNGDMLKKYPKATVLAFPGGKGTEDCIRQAVSFNRIVFMVHK